jgi:hypothetical protein
MPLTHFFRSAGARGVFVAGSVAVVLSISEPVGVGLSGVRSDVSELPGWPGGMVDAGVSPGPLVGDVFIGARLVCFVPDHFLHVGAFGPGLRFTFR